MAQFSTLFTVLLLLAASNPIFPVFFVLMDKKTKNCYASLFHYIKNNIFDMKPAVIITDYEQGLRNALHTVFPNGRYVGCWFHYCQAIRRNISSRKSLLQYIRTSKPASVAYHKIMALPLLPPTLIKEAFIEIRSGICLMDSQNKFASFLIYFEKQWIKKIVCPSSKLSSERRDRAPYIEPNGHSPQYLTESGGLGASRSRKAKLPAPPTYYQANDDELNETINRIFNTTFGPGLHLFNNTAPMGNPPHFNPYTDYMHADQPQSQIPPSPSSFASSLSSSTESDFFKVQRSPSGKLNLVYNKDYVQSKDVESSSHTVSGRNSSSGNSQKTHRTDTETEIHREKDSSANASNPNHTSNISSPINVSTEEPSKEDINYTVNSEDCVEKDGESNGKPFCTNLRNYPERTHLEQIIKKKFSNLELFFGEDLVLPQNISQRMNNEPNEEFLCKSRTRVIYPEAGLNKDYNWLIIVNIPNYKQGIRIEECINEGSTCGESNGLSLPNHYTATCKQSYIYRSLVAYTNETVIRDQFKMPSCCKCVLRTG